LFSDKKVIAASRNFVCVRIDSYESEENQKIVRSHLGGRFENTAFCVLAPDGEKRLTRSGRGPHHVSREFSDIAKIADNYRPRGKAADSRVPDFNSFKLALNVASADQRVLILIAGDTDQVTAAEKRLRALAWSEDVIGRFHYDFESDAEQWQGAISKAGTNQSGIYLIKPDTFGLEGEVLAKLALKVSPDQLKKAMAEANARFAKTTEKKVYSEHVSAGRRAGKKIVMPMEFGEDRDGDGKIDHRGGARGRRPPGRRPPPE